MISLGYLHGQGDHTLFIKNSPDRILTLLLVYVDDIVTVDDEIKQLTLKEKLTTQFQMKELGKLKYFLRIEVAYSKQGIFISQRKYVLDLLKETGKFGFKTSGVPIEQNHRIGCEESPTIEKFKYHRLLSHTRPDIAYVVSVVSQFMHDPRERHLQVVERIIQYLKASLGKLLLFRKEGTLSMQIYTNANYIRSVADRKSTFGYCIFLGRNLIILDDLKVKYKGPIKLFCDNNSAISIAHNPVQHDKTKHIDIGRHFIKEKLNSELVVTTHVPTRLQVVDIFIKGFLATRFQERNGKLGMIDIHLPT
ncbi:Copia protein, partial [Mucuna pruriens]